MHDVYAFLAGPMAALSISVFLGGLMLKTIRILYSVYRKERFVFQYFSLKHSLRSLAHWLTPFAATNMRQHPYMTIVTFVFHIGIILVPIFLLSHIVLWDEYLDIRWAALPDPVADGLSLLVIGACIFFAARRVVLPEVRYLTSPADFILLLMVAFPFLTGFYAYHQWPGYAYVMIAHIVSGELLLIAIPFTRLSHMIVGLFTRVYTASEFGGVKNAKDW